MKPNQQKHHHTKYHEIKTIHRYNFCQNIIKIYYVQNGHTDFLVTLSLKSLYNSLISITIRYGRADRTHRKALLE